MPDLEERLRHEVNRTSDLYEPPGDLPELIAARVERHRRVRRATWAGIAAGVLVAAAAAGAIVTSPGDDRVEMSNEGRDATTTAPTTAAPEPSTTAPPTTGPTTSTTAPTPTTGPPATSTTTATTATTAPPTPTVRSDTPLSRPGIGPIAAGMTLREAAEASGNTIGAPDTIGGPGSGDSCGWATLEGTDLSFLVTMPADPAADPMEAVVDSVQGGTSTVEGVRIGDPLTALEAAYGAPTRTSDYPYLEGGRVVVYESGGFAYSATLDASNTVTELESGSPTAVANLEGCA